MSDRGHTYFWNGTEVLIDVGGMGMQRAMSSGYKDMFCIDGYEDAHDYNDHARYGKYTIKGWDHVPFEDFPPLFKVHLLLLGVS